MAKSVPSHLANKAGKCIFCDKPGLSKTHIWPEWLNKLLSPPSLRLEELDKPIHLSGTSTEYGREKKLRQGSVFTQKPYLACISCNTGWMKKYEDEMEKFARPIFSTFDAVTLNDKQMGIMAVWVALITILAEYIDRSKSSVTIPASDRKYVKRFLKPPPHWSIFAVSLAGQKWVARYRHHSTFIGQFTSLGHYYAAIQEGRKPNTQISSFGIGNLFVHVFSCPDPRFVADFRRDAIAAKLIQLWPIPSALWPFAKRTAKFPTNLVINDDDADILSDAYNERIKALTQPPSFETR